jgi:hypothetical protein
MVAANVAGVLAGFAANRSCGDWASTMGQSQVGHSDGAATGRFSAHASGCTEAGIRATAGAGRIYCFATMP